MPDNPHFFAVMRQQVNASFPLVMNRSFGFQANEVTLTAEGQVSVNVQSLLGGLALMPYAYSAKAARLRRAGDESVTAFFNLFIQAPLRALYRSWARMQCESGERQLLQRSLSALSGARLLPQLTAEQQCMQLGYQGFYRGVRSLAGLQKLLQWVFQVEVNVSSGAGAWVSVKPLVNACLGRGAMLGQRVWMADHYVTVLLSGDVKTFLDGAKLDALRQVVVQYLGATHAVKLKLQYTTMSANAFRRRLGVDAGLSAQVDCEVHRIIFN